MAHTAFNVFRVLADLSHITAKCILIFSIHRNRSAEGVSWLTQIFYALVFMTRYTDLFRVQNRWNHFFKIFYLLSSFYTIAIMRFLFPRTREKELAWKMAALILAGCLVVSPFAMLILERRTEWAFLVWIWDFSEILESVCVLPQLLLLRQTTVPTVITSFYIVFLGSYRALYLLNWIWRAADPQGVAPNRVSVVCGVIQTALYVDFAWVYWTRQRVKLRNGGIVDADDLRRGWLLSRIFGRHVVDDEEAAPTLGGGGRAGNGRAAAGTTGGGSGTRAKWGSRGISISADDGILEHDELDDSLEEHGVTDAVDVDARLRDPDELAKALDEEDEEERDREDAPLQGHIDVHGEPSGLHNGNEWRDQ